ncbi:serine/threonine-protein kinase Nek2-like [Sycon ciliatum]|uniref:serine/threonine-protein kinase Nek2-like n=1 Tax=Sycon ciliatum TaxID=27933 RepID=UPI0031F6FF2F|eukprot:scpid17314/ scgid19147/ Serine/threonine-protein kinase Nek2; HSPK 21; Never in mitosis A-related kinase 2; NimA-like protein kinase 1
MPAGTLDDYEVLNTIGSGSYGTCKKIKRVRDGKILVWKEIAYGIMSEDERRMLVSEVNVLRELRHEHIVRYHDRVQDKTTSTLFIVMEYCEGGDLAKRIDRRKKRRQGGFDEPFVWRVLYQLASALSLCHHRKQGGSILHRDIKPANVFLDDKENIKLGDFGLARILGHDTSMAKTFVGTPYYMSPEQVLHDRYNDKSDMWSLGCLVYELCSLRPPFQAANQKLLALKIREGRFQPLPSTYSSDLRSLVEQLLTVEAQERPNIDTILAHPQLKRQQQMQQPAADVQQPPHRPAIKRKASDLQAPAKEPVRAMSSEERQAALDQRELDLQVRAAELKAWEARLKIQEAEAEDKLRRAETILRQQRAESHGQLQVLKPRASPPVAHAPAFGDAGFDIFVDEDCREAQNADLKKPRRALSALDPGKAGGLKAKAARNFLVQGKENASAPPGAGKFAVLGGQENAGLQAKHKQPQGLVERQRKPLAFR